MWVERGFSRREIVPRLMKVATNLTVYSSTEQPITNTEALFFPPANSPEAIEIINQTTERHTIDALWVQKSAAYPLNDISAEVHTAASPEIISLVDDKIAFSSWLGDDPYRPFAVEAQGAEDINNLYTQLHAAGHEVCVKPVIGVNGEGYWKLSEHDTSLLRTPEERIMHPDVYLHALSLQEATKGPQRTIVMDWLPGPEVSVDVLTWKGQPLIHAARTKIDGRTQRIQSEHEVIDHTHSLSKKLGFHGIISFQYRLDTEGNWKILEINPRPAGGSTHSEDAGFGIIGGWAKLISKQAGPNDIIQHHDDVTLTARTHWQ